MQYLHEGQVTDLLTLKDIYRKLCKVLHPDKGGSTEAMQVLNAEYEKWIAHFTSGAGADASEYGEGKRWATPENHAEVEAKIREAIERVAHLEGLEFELIGSWVWVDGATREHKETLKDADFHWAPKRKKWYFDGVPSKGRGTKSFDDLRAKYGSTFVNPENGKRQLRSA